MVQPRPVSLSLLHLGGFSLVFAARGDPLMTWLSVRHFGTFDVTGRMKREAHRCLESVFEREEE